MTFRISAECSNQLSYTPMLMLCIRGNNRVILITFTTKTMNMFSVIVLTTLLVIGPSNIRVITKLTACFCHITPLIIRAASENRTHTKSLENSYSTIKL